jgi:hypothetical protein
MRSNPAAGSTVVFTCVGTRHDTIATNAGRLTIRITELTGIATHFTVCDYIE